MDTMRLITYGIMFLSLVLISSQEVVETEDNKLEEPGDIEASRRHLQGKPLMVMKGQTDTTSPWCEVAQSCTRTMVSVCGFDDTFGYSKFEDICHMLQVNCYWKYDFAFIPSCNLLDN